MTEETEKRGPGRPRKEAETVACEVMRDYWPAEDERVRAGTIVQLDPMAAIDGIESGIMRRVK